MPHPLPPLTAIAKVDASSHRAFNSSAIFGVTGSVKSSIENSTVHRRGSSKTDSPLTNTRQRCERDVKGDENKKGGNRKAILSTFQI
ncbi:MULTISPECIES: hypothetical protein [Geobacillus]|uniref:hypothetical protein n=1 Tax=Geobacillus TaxID=129337 RepID=UPI00093CC6BA|nr:MULTISPECIES: hypothetical protein [Geobacillus]OPX01150.1 hypothetical protein B1A75_16625 [Geobacillus sp. LEMMY01]